MDLYYLDHQYALRTLKLGADYEFIAATNGLTIRRKGAYLAKSVAGAVDVTLTAAETAPNIIKLTGAITANIAVIINAGDVGPWAFWNATTGSFSVTVKYAAGTGIAVTQGSKQQLFGDGTNIYAYTDLIE